MEKAVEGMHSAYTTMSSKLSEQVKNAVECLESSKILGNTFDEISRRVDEICRLTIEVIENHCKKITVIMRLPPGSKTRETLKARIKKAADVFKSAFDEIKHIPNLNVDQSPVR